MNQQEISDEMAAQTAAAQTAAAAAAQTAAAAQAQPGKAAGSVWGRLPESEQYLKFTPENNFTNKVRFIDGEPREKPSTLALNKMVYEFEVIDLTTPEPVVLTWSISSIRLMRSLSAYLPLDGKAFQAIRTGDGMGINYIITPIV